VVARDHAGLARAPHGAVRVALAVLVLLCACESGRAVREGYVTTDDSVRLYYRIVGDGSETVVIPVGLYLEDLLAPLARPSRRLVFYDPRHRGRSGRGDLAHASLDRQISDLEQIRTALGIERMAVIGWSGYGMEMAVYAIRHPTRVTRLVQVAPIPPAARIFRAAGGDQRAARIDTAALGALDRRFRAGEFASDGGGYCRARNRLTGQSNFADTTLAARVPDVCRWENEWPTNLGPYFEAFLPSLGDFDWRDEIAGVAVPRLIIHGNEDGIPLSGARAWVDGFPNARLIVLSPAGHFPFLERADEFFPAVDRFLAGDWPPNAKAVP
jgi:proline iminopeptidase